MVNDTDHEALWSTQDILNIMGGCEAFKQDTEHLADNVKQEIRKDLDALQKVVLDCGSMEQVRHFARDIPGADIAALQQVVLDYGSGMDAYRFAQDVTGADIKALQGAVYARGSGDSAFLFAKDIPGANIQVLQHVVLNRGDSTDLMNFAAHIPSANKDALYNAVLNRAEHDAAEAAAAAYWFAVHYEGADIQALQYVILQSGNQKLMYDLARNVAGVDLRLIRSELEHCARRDSNFLFVHKLNDSVQSVCDAAVDEFGVSNNSKLRHKIAT